MFVALWNGCKELLNQVKKSVKQWTKPATVTLAVSAINDLSKSKADLIVENAMLRQQLIVLKLSVKQPKFTNSDRVRLTLLARLTKYWQSAPHIVQPDTVLPWHRDMFKRYWRRKSQSKNREPRTPLATISLIKQMARENLLWGAEEIHGELLKLGIEVSKSTIQKYIDRVRQSSAGGQAWSTFLKNHALEIWACDFTVVHDLFFRPIYIFIVIKHGNRQIMHIAETRHPTDAWVAQQLREATSWNCKPRFLIRDNDKKYGQQFSAVASSSGIKVLRTPLAAPRANPICERFIGSLRRECLDHFIIFSSSQLKRIISQYATYHNDQRPHQLPPFLTMNSLFSDIRPSTSST